ncbi:MAG: sulfide/dihydroorotate dehydrogenase-like FAD/NAD-binding protein [Bradymonadales bacterium]|nr:sulfide/dihydroorotate dehydrogenase-like FAD/NAD-binding protein [Bradymonadales bacterium]
MYEILEKKVLGPQVTWLVVRAPEIARKRKAGQFIILRVWEEGERIPLTIADADVERGTITLVSQSVGKTTSQLATLEVGDHLADLVGPLGTPTHVEQVGTVVCVGGGIGIAPIYPITQAMKGAGNHVISILGARNKDLLIMEEMMRAVSDETVVVTDDGSYGKKGFVTNALQEIIDSGRRPDLVIAIGPPIMMKMVVKVTRPFDIPTLVSLNSIMIDGTGMCGGCRVSVGGKARFVCVDGPEFDGFSVDFDELMQRLSAYREHECMALARWKEQQAEPK